MHLIPRDKVQHAVNRDRQEIQRAEVIADIYHLVITVGAQNNGLVLRLAGIQITVSSIVTAVNAEDILRTCGLLRHSFATIFIENGDDIKTVQANRTSCSWFTLKTYAHVSDRMQQNSAARMEELISSLESAE